MLTKFYRFYPLCKILHVYVFSCHVLDRSCTVLSPTQNIYAFTLTAAPVRQHTPAMELANKTLTEESKAQSIPTTDFTLSGSVLDYKSLAGITMNETVGLGNNSKLQGVFRFIRFINKQQLRVVN